MSVDPFKRPSFNEIYQTLFSKEYKIIASFLDKSFSRISAYDISKPIHKSDMQIIRDLGEGTSGRATLIINKKTNKELVVKEFHDVGKPSTSDGFLIEYITLRSIEHPNIVKIFGASPGKQGRHGSRIFMEYASGGDLSTRMNESFEDFMIHLFQISSAMKYLHRRWIVHLDLKPANILIRGDGSACVTDFNTAKKIDSFNSIVLKRGTEGYIAPEVENMKGYSFPADVFSFGVIAAEYFSTDAKTIISSAINRNENPDISFIKNDELRTIVKKCLYSHVPLRCEIGLNVMRTTVEYTK